MAVVFIAPKQRQKMFFLGITVIFLAFLALVFLGVFSAKPSKIASPLVFNKPKVAVDTSIFNSEQFQKLKSLPAIDNQFDYTALDSANKKITGIIYAVSISDAKIILEGRGLSVLDLREAKIGRENPFTPY